MYSGGSERGIEASPARHKLRNDSNLNKAMETGPGRHWLGTHRVVFPAPEAPCNSATRNSCRVKFALIQNAQQIHSNTARAIVLVQSPPSGL